MAAVKDALDPSWINKPDPEGPGPSYDSEELRRLQGFQLAGGATAGTSRTGVLNPRDLLVSLSGNNVQVGAGGCVIGTAKGAYVAGLAATTTIGALLAADVTNPRRDRVVLEILDPDNGGGAGRKAQLRIMDGTPNASAATGGGFPAAPTSPFIDLGFADMPKFGAGAPSVTINAPLTAAAGAPIPVRSSAERDSLPVWPGVSVVRLDRGGLVERHDGSKWVSGDDDTGWINVPLINTFTHYLEADKWIGLRYRIRGGWVTINGAVRRPTAWSSGQVIGTMPTLARPHLRFQGTGVEVDGFTGYLIVDKAGTGNGTPISFSATYPLG